VIEASPIAIAIGEFMNPKKYWRGTATEFLNELEKTAEDLKIKIVDIGMSKLHWL
jgi:hypothetical protein